MMRAIFMFTAVMQAVAMVVCVLYALAHLEGVGSIAAAVLGLMFSAWAMFFYLIPGGPGSEKETADDN